MSSPATNLKRSPLIDSALHILKGAICLAFKIPVGRTTKKIRFNGNHGTMVIGSIDRKPTPEDIDGINYLIREKINQDSDFLVFKIEREKAESLYGEEMYDDFGISREITSLRLVCLKKWNLNANINPVLKSTGLISEIKILKFKFSEAKKTLEIDFKVFENKSRLNGDINNIDDFTCVESNLEEGQYPNLNDVKPQVDDESCDAIIQSNDQMVTPWTVKTSSETGIDYDKLIKLFGCSLIQESHINRIEKITNRKAHHLLRRRIFFSHRDLDIILNACESGKKFYLYTGRGPSSESLHLGHLIPFLFTKYLQDAFDVPLVIQMTDDEKFLFKDHLDFESVRRSCRENIKDIIACGFNADKTLIFCDSNFIKELYPMVLEIQKKTTLNQSLGTFGFNGNDNIGKIGFVAIEAAPAFSKCFKNSIFGNSDGDLLCLVPQAIDQEPYFRLARHVAPRLLLPKPAVIHSKFIPSLIGFKNKMSSDDTMSSIYVNDSISVIKKKIFKNAFSGGGATEDEHRKCGANLDVDVSFFYLSCLIEDDDELNNIAEKYKSGEMLTCEIKQILFDKISKFVSEYQERRKNISEEEIEKFMDCSRHLL